MALTKVGAGVLNIDDLYGFRNRVINGDMRIDQRNAGASRSVDNLIVYTLDRWRAVSSQGGTVKYTVQRNDGSVTPPPGFTNYLGVTVTTAFSLPESGQFFSIDQIIEGYNVADLDWGTPNAKTITISFWIRSSIVGTYSFAVRNNASNRSFIKTYTINSANTWEYKTLTIPGDTSGTWEKTNGRGVEVFFDLGRSPSFEAGVVADSWLTTGAVRLGGTVKLIENQGATWQITGVQLEVGTVATPFERRPFGTELALCQRYAYVNRLSSSGGFGLSGYFETSTAALITIRHPVEMRASPTFSFSAANTFFTQTTSNITPSAISLRDANTFGGVINPTVSGASAGNGCHLVRNTGNGTESTITASAEL
jgi:hypothetical protein